MQINFIMQGLMNGKNAGLLSEAGCPSIADPGAEVIQYAHRNNIRVVPLVDHLLFYWPLFHQD